MSNTLRSLTNINAFPTVSTLAWRLGALYLADWLLAFDITEGVLGFLAGCMTLGWLAHRVADWLTNRAIALPVALRMAIHRVLGDDLGGSESE